MRSWPDLPLASAADHAACRQHLRAGSRSFHAAALLLPDTVRAPATALYAFCRVADDAVDLGTGAGLGGMRERLALAYAGRPLADPVDRAFADVVAEFAIPRALPEALFEGFAWDAAARRYEDLAALRAYAARVAGTVGVMMALLMGVRDPAVLARACDLGVAMQLSNIARDVAEDARAGRLYLPLAWLREAGIDPEAWLARPGPSPALAAVVQRLLDEADRLYRRSVAGIDRLPLACRPAIHAARLLYAEIGREVGRRGGDPFRGRAVVAWQRKLALLVLALLATPARGGDVAAPVLPEVAFLVAAALPEDAARAVPARSWWRVSDRVEWLVHLYGRLERREQLLRSTGRP